LPTSRRPARACRTRRSPTSTSASRLARLSVAAGDLDTAAEVATAVEAAAANPFMPEILFRAALCRALAGGPVDAALAAFNTLDHDQAILIDLLLDQETLADLLAERGRSDDAVRLLHDATDAWEEIGAPYFAARTLAKLRALGVRRGARGSRDRPATGWEALTPTERQVADLILDGLTYREIGERQWISKRTVETHARHIFAKLGVANRRELAAHAPANGAILTR
jgi:DNA-binding CsgD family transcriptional regulator